MKQAPGRTSERIHRFKIAVCVALGKSVTGRPFLERLISSNAFKNISQIHRKCTRAIFYVIYLAMNMKS
jgi:hypothetical protein